MFGFNKKKAEKEEILMLKQAVQTGFNSVKQDISNVGIWLKHLDAKDSKLKEEFLEFRDEVALLKEEVENLKNIIAILSERPAFKQKQPVFSKQTSENTVLNGVQTSVQTEFLDNLSATERAIIFVLLNSDMKLSYEDLAAILGKNKATIRGQINTIRQKSEGLVEEVMGENNKKRIYIPEKIKESLIKTKKLKLKGKNKEKEEESD
ncbi:MAG: hypothetical protein WC867_04710 [Candidatus Pacearchaeota archaeon]|jgi:predicted transcriptional regulator